MLGHQIVAAQPHHGAWRLMMQVPASSRGVPQAPRVAVSREEGRRRIEWSAHAQEVNGYRVEYRIGDGSWNEITGWFEAFDLSTTWSSLRAGQTYAFRLRAFNNAGTSQYSAPATFRMPSQKRRSVR